MAGEWGCVTRSPYSLFLIGVSSGQASCLVTPLRGQSCTRCWPVIGAVSQVLHKACPSLECPLAMLLPDDIVEKAALQQVLAGHCTGMCRKVSIRLVPQSLSLRPCFLPDGIAERAVLQQVLVGHCTGLCRKDICPYDRSDSNSACKHAKATQGRAMTHFTAQPPVWEPPDSCFSVEIPR